MELYNQSQLRKIFLHVRNKEENSPLIFSCYLSMLWSDTYKDYEREMMQKYDEIQKKFEAGAITMEEYDEEISNNLPNPADEYYSAKL